MYDIISIGGATLDIFMKDKAFEIAEGEGDARKLCMDFGSKILADDVHFTYGGGGMNTANSFASLGLKAAYVGSIGDDDIGRSIEANLQKAGIADEFLQKTEGKSGISVILHAGKRERTIIAFRGANDELTPEVLPIQKMQENTKWLYLAHLSGKADACCSMLATAIKEKGLKLAWNPGSTQLKKGAEGLKDLLEQTTILNVNKQEAEELTGVAIPRDTSLSDDQIDDVEPLLAALAEYGPEIVVITDGQRGAAVLADNKVITSKNHDIAATKDTTGAGDAFGSGFAAGYIATGDPQEALQWGIVQGGAVITEFGAQNGHLSRERMNEEVQKLKSVAN